MVDRLTSPSVHYPKPQGVAKYRSRTRRNAGRDSACGGRDRTDTQNRRILAGTVAQICCGACRADPRGCGRPVHAGGVPVASAQSTAPAQTSPPGESHAEILGHFVSVPSSSTSNRRRPRGSDRLTLNLPAGDAVRLTDGMELIARTTCDHSCRSRGTRSAGRRHNEQLLSHRRIPARSLGRRADAVVTQSTAEPTKPERAGG